MIFKFKKFTLTHKDDVFKFGTDAALLGVWSNLKDVNSVLEIGAGSGVITLMMAQRSVSTNFTGIDISVNAVNLAKENALNSPFTSRFEFIDSSLQNFEPKEKFDLIVSNPPFFESSTK